jgi:regulator of protease activity HflC (stomatin/prohibitin superfamily)
MLDVLLLSIKAMFWIILIVLVLLLPSILFIVRGKTAAILETFGRPHKSAVFPGLHAKLPWPITVVVARVNLQIQEIHADVSVKTSDNAFLTLPVKVQYRASDDAVGAVKAHYELEAPEKQITSYVLNNVRQTASGMEMTDLYANRDNVEQQVQVALSEQFARFGYIIENVLVDEPQPSPEVRDAFNQVIASKRLMEAARNEAEAQRIKLVGAAQAEAESKKLQGEGMAQMREAIARGLEEAMQTMMKSGLSTEQSIQFLSDTNRLDTITSAATHGNTIIIDAGANKDLAGMAAMLESINKK